jgi:excisionase family DNA binding protein
MSKLLTVKQAAKRLELSSSKVYRMTWSGELYAQRIGRAVRIPEASVEQLTNPPEGYVPSTVVGGAK